MGKPGCAAMNLYVKVSEGKKRGFDEEEYLGIRKRKSRLSSWHVRETGSVDVRATHIQHEVSRG